MKQKNKGLVVINTGDGKGKTTAAFGVLFRALGRKMKCAVVQYIKGKWKTGERIYAETIEDLSFHVMGLGFTWESSDLNQDSQAAQAAWEKSKEYILDDIHDVVILDELTYAIQYKWIDVNDVIGTLKKRPEMKHVIITGRGCHEDLIEYADLVTEMTLVKHPYKNGIAAQKGIEF